MRYRLRTPLILFALAPAALAYVGSYYVLSRRGYADADKFDSTNFWFVAPETQRDVKRNAELRRLYWPLMQFERLAGSDRFALDDPCGIELPP